MTARMAAGSQGAMIDVRPVIHAISKLAIVMGVMMAAPAAVDWSAGAASWRIFAATGAGTALVAWMVMLATRHEGRTLTLEQAFLLTSGLWLVLPVIGAMPIRAAVAGAGFTDAMFEAMSGLSTTGATAFPELGALSDGVHLWRGLLQWSGGLGIVVVAMVFLPVMRVGGMQFFRSEGFDTMGKVMPRAGSIAAEMTELYLGITILCAMIYAGLGMSGFDAVMHALTTCSTGGFSNLDASFGAFIGAPEVAATVFMILASLPFVRMVQAMHGDFAPLWRDSQIWTFLAIIAVVCTLIVIYQSLWLDVPPSLGLLREVAFNVVTIMTGTGYASVDVTQWGHLPFVLLITVGLIGGCTGSTSGSIKIFRWQILFGSMQAQMIRMLQPHRVVVRTYNGKPVQPDVVDSVINFVFAYILSYVILTLLIAAMGLDLLTASSSVASALAGAGPCLGPIVGPAGTFAPLPDGAKWVLCLAMLLGRLEVFTVIVLFTRTFWKR